MAAIVALIGLPRTGRLFGHTMTLHRIRASSTGQSAIPQFDPTICLPGYLGVVGGDQYKSALSSSMLREQLNHNSIVMTVKATRWFVSKNQRRSVYEGTRYSGTLALPA